MPEKSQGTSAKISAFFASIVKKAADQAQRQDVLDGLEKRKVGLKRARRSFAAGMGDREKPLALFWDFKNKGGTRGMLLTDRYLYSSHVPQPLPLDRIRLAETTGGGFTPEVLRVNGAIVLLHRQIDTLALAIVQAIAREIRSRDLFGRLIKDERIAALTNSEHVAVASKAVAAGQKHGQVVAAITAKGAGEETAQTLSRGLLAMTEPGGVTNGLVMILIGGLASPLVVLLLLEPLLGVLGMEFVSPIHGVAALLGCVVFIGSGVAMIRAARRGHGNAVELAEAWNNFLTPREIAASRRSECKPDAGEPR